MKILLDISAAQLDVLLSRIELVFTSHAGSNPIRGAAMATGALKCGPHCDSYDAEQLAAIYVQLVSHWKGKNTAAGESYSDEFQLAHGKRNRKRMAALADKLSAD